MSASTTILFKETPGSKDVVLAEITLSGTYAAGGYALAAVDLKASRIKALGIIGVTAGWLARWNPSTSCIEMLYPAPGAGTYPAAGREVPAATSLTGVVVTVLAFVE